MSVYLDRGVIPYSEGGGLVHKPSESLDAYQLVEPGNLVLNNQQAWRGSVGVSKYRGIVSPAYLVFELSERLDPSFANYQFRETRFVDEMMLSSQGVGDIQRQVKKPLLRYSKVFLPPIKEQRAIAAHLDRATTRIDALVAKKTRFIELLREKRQALITHAVTKGLDVDVPMKDSGVEWLGEVPACWNVHRLAYVFREVARTGHPDLPVLSISIHDGISDDELDDAERSRKVTLIEDRSKYKKVVPGDLAYNMMRAWQGAFGAVGVAGQVSPAYVVAEPKMPVNTSYVELLLRTPMAIEEMRRFSRGIADFRSRLYWEHFRDIRICLPPREEQDHILSKLAARTTRIDTLTAKTERSIELLREHRVALITAAVTGKRDLRK